MTTTYYGNINPELLDWIPLTIGRVLEIGCGDAALAAAYRERNPGVHYTAVEMHGPSAEVAATRVDRLLTGDFGAMTDLQVSQGAPFDAIVLGDVLEHLADPVAVLARLRSMLGDDGHLVLSVPNVSHWSALFHLMNGRWPAQDSGLFDRTHLRFFTHQSLLDTLREAGFAQVKARPRNVALDREKADAWMPALSDLAGRMGIDRAAFLQRSSALQYVVVARKSDAPAPRLMRLSVAALAPRLLEVRAQLPAARMQSVPDLAVTYREREVVLPPAGTDDPKILIIQRPAPPDADAWLQRLAEATRRGWLVVTEYDDHPDLVGDVLGWDNGAPTHWTILSQVHAVQTSTPALAKMFRAHNPEVAVFPNTAFDLPPPRPATDGPPRVFHGALNRGEYSVAIARALAPAIAAAPDMEFEIVHDRAFFDALPTTRKRFQPTLAYDAYLATLRTCDIALLPLEGRPQEMFKSDLKYVEAGAAGAAVIASPAVYAAIVRDGETGLIADAPADWAAALMRLATDPVERRRIAANARTDIRENRIFADQIRVRLGWYRDLWARRDALRQGLLARAPGLAALLKS